MSAFQSMKRMLPTLRSSRYNFAIISTLSNICNTPKTHQRNVPCAAALSPQLANTAQAMLPSRDLHCCELPSTRDMKGGTITKGLKHLAVWLVLCPIHGLPRSWIYLWEAGLTLEKRDLPLRNWIHPWGAKSTLNKPGLPLENQVCWERMGFT